MCHELKVEGYPSDYKCVYCIVNRQIKHIKGNYIFTINLEVHKEEIQRWEYKFSNQSLQLKSIARDLNKACKETEDLKENNHTLTPKLSELESDKIKLNLRCQDLEDKVKHDSNNVMLLNNNYYSLQRKR
jgi:predicted RNase H-like nuclease (RuvC/YqgF family)